MNILVLITILSIAGWFYDRARRRNNNVLAKAMIGIASFFIGLTMATFLMDFLVRESLPDNSGWQLIAAALTSIFCVWGSYRVLKKVLLSPKTQENTPLDADLMRSNNRDNDHL